MSRRTADRARGSSPTASCHTPATSEASAATRSRIASYCCHTTTVTNPITTANSVTIVPLM